MSVNADNTADGRNNASKNVVTSIAAPSLTTMSNTTETILSMVAYSVCSGSLVLVNKLILHHLPFPSLVMTVQLWSTLLFIFVASHLMKLIECDPLTWANIKPYLWYTMGFSFGIYCNMRSLAESNVETVIVFRAMAPLLVSVADAIFLGREWPSKRSWGALALIVFGAYQYASYDEQFQSMGIMAYLWPTAYLFVISFEMAYGKKLVKSVQLETKSGPVLYANLLGWPPMIVFALMGGEFGKLQNRLQEQSTTAAAAAPVLFTPISLWLLLGGCIIGTGIGYSGWWCRAKVSATSYTVIGVMNKCLTVFANYLIWDQHANHAGIASLFICLVGGTLYQQAPMRKEHKTDLASRRNSDTTNDDEEEGAPLMRPSKTNR
eukprot:CAMPEP_0119008066 /NCGR_PEP_ID=MMETSP1176-20130426/3442_1 /TAXON_ID=265551 /ORGANISM="Synedropsis recta cf, Strain CCMP1620" /LENGTH=377 /DNA_ID=CAMNT_0006960327 /DNA_START=167 /DNA_END=1300 /DNA_ORIENTATION=+